MVRPRFLHTSLDELIYRFEEPTPEARWHRPLFTTTTTGASITNKGAFYERGREPHPGDPPKLSLLIESNDSFRVEHAIREIKRHLLEGTQAYLDGESRTSSMGGRYSVV